MNLKGKNIIVTGASWGIWYAVSELIIEMWWQVLALDIDSSWLEEMKKAFWESIETYSFDISNREKIAKFFKSIDAKEVHWLVNNAWIYLSKNILEYTENDVDLVWGVNMKSLFFMTQEFWKKNFNNWNNSVIVNISSIAWQEGGSDAIYAASKAAMVWFSKSIAQNFAPYIRVNTIAPWVVKTKMMENIPKERLKEYADSSLLWKIATPVDVAQSCIFLLSEWSNSYTGSTFDLNNGCYLR